MKEEGEIMTFKGKIAAWWYVAIAVLDGIAIAAVIYNGLSLILAVNVIAVAFVNLFFIPPIFKNNVTITKKDVIVTFGLLTKTIPIQGITIVKIMKNYSASFAAYTSCARVLRISRSRAFVRGVGSGLVSSPAVKKQPVKISSRPLTSQPSGSSPMQ